MSFCNRGAVKPSALCDFDENLSKFSSTASKKLSSAIEAAKKFRDSPEDWNEEDVQGDDDSNDNNEEATGDNGDDSGKKKLSIGAKNAKQIASNVVDSSESEKEDESEGEEAKVLKNIAASSRRRRGGKEGMEGGRIFRS